MQPQRLFILVALFVLATVVAYSGAVTPSNPAKRESKVSFSKQVQPILQANCYGCHQPAKAKGELPDDLPAAAAPGRRKRSPAVVPGKPEKSQLLEMIAPQQRQGGNAARPSAAGRRRYRSHPPLDRRRRRRRQPEKRRGQPLDADHPPVYSRPPVVTSLDFSPDGKLLAVAGFHEALLWKADGSARVARLVGMSDRIETVRFSPDGTKLLVVGGNPCRSGEIQVWDVASHKLLGIASVIGFDTLVRRQLVARRQADRRGRGRQRLAGRSTPRPSSRSFTWRPMTTGFAAPCFPATASRCSRPAAT